MSVSNLSTLLQILIENKAYYLKTKLESSMETLPRGKCGCENFLRNLQNLRARSEAEAIAEAHWILRLCVDNFRARFAWLTKTPTKVLTQGACLFYIAQPLRRRKKLLNAQVKTPELKHTYQDVFQLFVCTKLSKQVRNKLLTAWNKHVGIIKDCSKVDNTRRWKFCYYINPQVL